MKVSCPSCSSVLNIDDKKIPAGGARIKCPSCQNVFPVKPAPATVSSSPSGVVPLPGISAPTPQRQDWEEEATRVATVPLPAAAIPGATTIAAPPTNVKLPATRSSPSSASIPLPGISAAPAQRQSWEDEATRVGEIPLPGAAGPAVDLDFGEAPTASIPLPGASSARTAAIPLPGEAPTSIAPAYEPPPAPTGSIPLPGGAPPPLPRSSASIPLPGSAPPPLPRSGASIPLPGSASPLPQAGGIPLPGGAATGSSIPLPGGAPPLSRGIPLPGGAAGGPGAIPLPGTAPARSGGSIPLPGAGPAGIPLPGGASSAIPLPGAGDEMEFDPSGGEAIPLPSPAEPSFNQDPAMGGGFDLTEAPPETSGGFDFDAPAQAPVSGGFDFDAPPAPAPVAGGFDFDAPPAPAPGAGGFDFDAPPAPAPVSGGFDFSEAPPAPASGDFDFSEPAAPAPAASGFDFDAAPPPAPGGFDFNAPPPPAVSNFDFGPPPAAPAPAAPAAPMGFGEVDFGGGDLEFDPTGGAASAAPAAARPLDDLEADISAPIPQTPAAPAGPADGLEMLSFIDKSAQEAGARPDEVLSVRRFHVKRRSGKVFGPFEEAVIVKMLEDGQLLGNEEVSLDSDSWQPIGTEPAFQAVIARLMESPARSQTQLGLPQVEEPQKGPSMDRLKQLYEGRMAAVAVVQGKEPVPLKKRLPLIIAGVLAASVLIGGVVLGLATPYGFFGLKVLFPAKVRPDTREFGYLQVARKGFLQDTWKSYKLAKDSANQALQIKEYPEARAVWCQAVFNLDRKFGKAEPGEVERANDELVNVRLLGEKHPEVLKTEAAAALSRKDADAALAAIADALARDSEDLESHFVRADAYLLKKQPAQAKAEYEDILKKDPKSAKALHALGLLLRAQNEIAEAAGRFSAALEADPAHQASAVELAEIAIVQRKEVERGNELLEKALGEEGRPSLSPSMLGKAQALKAESLVVQGKVADAVPLFEEALKADPANGFTNGRLANAYALLNQPEKAAPLYSVAVRAQPESIEYTEGYLSTLIILGKMDEATRVMQSANTRFPGNATLAYLTARVADVLDNAKEAEEAYKRAIAADPKIIDAYLYLSRHYMHFRRFAEAAPVLEAGLNQAPDNAAMRVGMGELALHERNLDRAEQEFKKAIELNPYSADAYLGASRVSSERGKYELAATQVARALELNPRISGGKLMNGVALWKLGKLDEAIIELEAAHEAEPKNTQIVVTLGAVKFDKGDLNGATAHLNSALVAAPSHPDANFYLARVKNAKSEHTQAIEAIKKALDYNSKNPLYLYWYGRILADARKFDDALAELKLALDVEPKYADALETMGRIYFDRNDFKRAVTYYQQALDADPARTAARALIGDAQMKMEDWSGAIASYTQALDADPELKQAFSKLGVAYQEKRQFTEAIRWFRKAVEAEPENADAWLALGYLFKDTNKKKDAKTAFTKYLELKPEAENKREVEDELHYLSQ
ncbi:MAG: tetratricopeptide repeat protein [Myxococcota bacterium]